MRTLYLGLKGDDVKAWEQFLVGIDPSSNLVVDGTFDSNTFTETKRFQTYVGFTSKEDVDGVVGPATMGEAMRLGFNPLDDDRTSETGPNWPPIPIGISPLSATDRAKLFGTFTFKHTPTSSNPEAITITDGWAAKNIVPVTIQQLSSVSRNQTVQFHTAAADRLVNLFSAWDQAGLKDRIKTWGGSWVPRYVRGSRTYLSNHAWGTAFDINVQWNMLGTRPALKGRTGSVRELVQIANTFGFYWGGHFKGRPDGMHFEAFR